MNIGLLIGIGVTAWTGWMLLQWLMPRLDTLPHRGLLELCMSFPLGAGALSCVTFGWLLVYGRMDPLLPVLEYVLAAAMAVALRFKGRPFLPKPAFSPAPGRMETLLLLLFGAALAAMVVAHVQMFSRSPHGGGFDAFATWNLRARFLFRGGMDWPLGFSEVIGWSHPDYPLLVPVTVARLWCHAGGDLAAAPALAASIWTFSTVGLLVWAVGSIRGRDQGLLAGLALAATPFFVMHGASQFADTPLSFYMLGTAVFGFLALDEAQAAWHESAWLMTGLCAGCAAWTKNEGIAFACIATALLSLHILRSGTKTQALRAIAKLAAGMAPLLCCLIFFKAGMAPSNDLVAGQSAGATWQRLVQPGRYWTVVSWFAERLFLFDSKGWMHITPVVAAHLLLMGTSPDHVRPARSRMLATMLALVTAAYAMAYVTTPNDLEWHLRTSLDRLILHLWPICLLLLFITTRTPSEIISARQPEPGAGHGA